MLPFPQQGEAAIEDEEIRVRTSDGERVNMMLKNNIEGIILKWAHQVSKICHRIIKNTFDCVIFIYSFDWVAFFWNIIQGPKMVDVRPFQ